MKSTVTCRLEAAGSALGRNSRTATSHWALRLSGSAAASLRVAQPRAYRVSPTKMGAVVSFVVAIMTLSNPLRHGELIFGLELLSLRLRRLPHEGGHAEQARSELATCMKQ